MAWRKPKNVSEWIAILWRHRYKFFFPALFAMTVVVLAGLRIEPTYTAEAHFQRENDPALRQTGNPTIEQNIAYERRILRDQLMGRQAVIELINDRELELNRQLPMVGGQLTSEGQRRKEELIDDIRNRLSMRFETRGDDLDQIVVTFNSTDRTRAPMLVNKLVTNYITKTRRRMSENLVISQRYYDEQVSEFRREVERLQRERDEQERQGQGGLPRRGVELDEDLRRVTQRIDTLSEHIEMGRAELRSIQAFLDNNPPMEEHTEKGMNPEYERQQQRVAALEDQYQEKRSAGYLPAHPELRKMERDIQRARSALDDIPRMVETGSTTRPSQLWHERAAKRDDLREQLVAYESALDQAREQRQRLEAQARTFYETRTRMARIERELRAAEDQLSYWEDQAQTNRQAQTQAVSGRAVSLDFTQPATELSRPSSPAMVSILGMAVVLGLGVGAGMVLWSELTNRCFRNAEHATDDLKMPVLGVVDEIVTTGQKWRRRLVTWGLMPAAGAAIIGVLLISLLMMYLNLERPMQYENMAPLQQLQQLIRDVV